MSYEFWIILTGVLVGVTCGTIGCLLIIRKMAMLSDGISHTVLLGIVLAYLISDSLSSVYMLIGALIVGMLTSVFVQYFSNRGIHTDASIGIVFTSLFALGVFLVSVFANQVHLDIDHVLMGEITFVPWNTFTLLGMDLGPQAVWMLGFVLIVNTLTIIYYYQPIKISSFDPTLATALGINVIFIHYLLMGMLSLSIVASFESVGSILVVTMLIVPGATAYLITRRLSSMMLMSALIGGISAILGYYIAYLFDVSIAGSMSSALGLIFIIVFATKLLTQKYTRYAYKKFALNKNQPN
ncbi:metal ABC transporter permease [Halalkalibacillus halophilus]|uniref:metal ABC transporter permease n=1 Tax=Halalkalibacillus halophilus TaxID=392827 RepID=UPI00042765E8|nr:metal ABC transporter permease [Halalkalibacillus halophilus]